MNFAGRFVAAASLVIEIDEVLDPMITPGRAIASTFARICFFSSSFSVAASMMKSHCVSIA